MGIRVGEKQSVWLPVLLLLMAALCEWTLCAKPSQAATVKNVKTVEELEQALQSSQELAIHLKADIAVGKCLRVKGKKLLDGGGTYRILRKAASGAGYQGTLIQMRGSLLQLTGITINGSGKNPAVSGAITGRLIEVSSGTVVLGSGAVLTANYNVSSAGSGGGGITVHAGGTAVMKPGSAIRDNLTKDGGSGVWVETGGMFVMEGGTIADNAVSRNGKESDFDGKGGAIHNRGVVLVKGGTVTGNVAVSAIYNADTLTVSGGIVSGEEDGICNDGGMVSVRGGTVKGRDCAVRTNGSCEIRGGVIRGNRYGIKYVAGTVSLSGSPQLNSIYVNENGTIDVDRKIKLDAVCELCPASYEEGRRLVQISSGEPAGTVQRSFSLRKKKKFMLKAGSRGLDISGKTYRIVFETNGGVGSMKDQWAYTGEKTSLRACAFQRAGFAFAGWIKRPGAVHSQKEISYREKATVQDLGTAGATVHLYAAWVKKPTVADEYGGVTFYEGEYIDRDILLNGVRASDECDGDLTKQVELVKVRLPDTSELTSFDTLPTKGVGIGSGEVVYRITNSFGISAEYRRSYAVVPNQKPKIKVSDRHYTVGAYTKEAIEQIKRDMLSRIRLQDDVETEEQLEKNRTVLWGKLDFQTAGAYPVTVRVKDQCGHRFYMPEGVERQYGTGKICKQTFTVYVTQEESGGVPTQAQENVQMERQEEVGVEMQERPQEEQPEERPGFVRFISQEQTATLRPSSVWRTDIYAEVLERTFQKDGSSCEEVWTISGEDKKKIRIFLDERENPFSRETNELFLQKFSYMKGRKR